MIAEECCPDCESPIGNSCPTCCSHYNTKTITAVFDGHYLQERIVCQNCGYYDVVNEIDYHTEFS